MITMDHSANQQLQKINSFLADSLEMLQQLQPKLPQQDYLMCCKTATELVDFYGNFWDIDKAYWYHQVIHGLSDHASALIISAYAMLSLGEAETACKLAKSALIKGNNKRAYVYLHAELLKCAGYLREARTAVREAMLSYSDGKDLQAILDTCDSNEWFPSPLDHYQLLRQAHIQLAPRYYLEIGVAQGRSLALAASGCSVIGIDPESGRKDLLLYQAPEVTPRLFMTTSDQFFDQGQLEQTWGEVPFDMAFIDGLHLFEQVLRDFINLEQRSHENSVIFIHDSLPINIAGAERERTTMVWTGDVWKVLACLKAIRPDLEIVNFPVRPSGLAMVRKLDRNSKVLATQFDALVAHFMDAKLPESMPERFHLLNVTEQPFEAVLESVLHKQGAWQ